EALLDVQEGADMLMVKPALAYGDLIRAVSETTGMPVAAYNVSGEYAMVKDAAAAGHIDERATVLEILTSLRRAGAETIITYHAKDAARWLAEKSWLNRSRRWPRRHWRTWPTTRACRRLRRRCAAARTGRRSRSMISTASCST